MKRKAIAVILAVVMTFGSAMPAFARYTPESSTYQFKDTEDLVIEIDKANDNIVLTWPAVDTEGKLIKANPLKAEGQVNSNGNPTAGWTTPTNGMIIEYDGWLPDGSSNVVRNDNKPNHNVLKGIVDAPVEGQAVQYPIYICDPKGDTSTSASAIKVAYIDTTPVSTSFATAYQIQYSLDGVEWKEDHIASTINHGKKQRRLAEDGSSLKEDNKNTFFLEDQITEALTNTLQPDTKYFIRVRAFDASNPATKESPYKEFNGEIVTPKKAERKPAFPTVEGGGTYSQGGRGGDVYVVTNLTDSVSNPQPGSLRYGLERKDGKSPTAPRIIVFAVGGTINIDPEAAKGARRMNVGSNTTILGQTAPGEGITIAGASMKFNGENIIVRYMDFRLGGGYDMDTATATGKNIVIDHCSFGWGVDEVFSAKEIINSSIQYNIITSGLAMPRKNAPLNSDVEISSGESEAKHGMGSILNGYETSYTHNLWAHNGTRNPRFEGGFTYNSVRYENKVDFANNVVYDWGHNSTYGGERGNGQMNFVGNYYKDGPETIDKVRTQFVDCNASSQYMSSYYIKDNIITSSPEATANNSLGFTNLSIYAKELGSPLEMEIPYVPTGAQEAYETVLNHAGSSFHRDAQDERLMYEVANGLGSFINDQAEAGGFSTATSDVKITDTDNDGIPDDYEAKLGTNPQENDSANLVEDEASPYNGYSYIEVYASDLLGEWDGVQDKTESAPNAQITQLLDKSGKNILKATGNTTLVCGEEYKVVIDKKVADMAVYLNDKVFSDVKLFEDENDYILEPQRPDSDSYTFRPDEVGVYNLSVLGSKNGHKSFSVAVPVTVVKGTEGSLDGFKSIDLGGVRAEGVDYYDKETGTLYTQGAGRIGTTKTIGSQEPDACHFTYKMVEGDFDIIAKLDNMSKIDYLQKSGIMVRASLDPSAEFYMAALAYLKGEDYEGKKDVTGGFVKAKNILCVARSKTSGPAGYSTFMGVPIVREGETPNVGYGRITREGNVITVSASLDGKTWYELRKAESATLPKACYVGFATAAAQDTSTKVRYNATIVSDIQLTAKTYAPMGDADCSGILTSNDAAAIVQYTIDKNFKGVENYDFTRCNVNGDVDAGGNDIIDAADASLVLEKVLNSDIAFPVENK